MTEQRLATLRAVLFGPEEDRPANLAKLEVEMRADCKAELKKWADEYKDKGFRIYYNDFSLDILSPRRMLDILLYDGCGPCIEKPNYWLEQYRDDILQRMIRKVEERICSTMNASGIFNGASL